MIYIFSEDFSTKYRWENKCKIIWLVNINAYIIWLKFARMDIKPFWPHLTFSTLLFLFSGYITVVFGIFSTQIKSRQARFG